MEPFTFLSAVCLSAVFVGEGTLLVQCAEIFLRAGHEVRAILSEDATIRAWAEQHQILYTHPDQDLAGLMRGNSFDYLFSVGNLRILPIELLALPQRGAINFHDAMLPSYAGVNATSWALINREDRHGVTWHQMTDRVDAGPILKQYVVEIGPDETALSLNARCYEAGALSFGELVKELSAGTVTPIDSDPEQRSYFGLYKRPGAACFFSWECSAEEIAALVRALAFGPYTNPLGLPKMLLGNEVLLVADVAVLDAGSADVPGTVTDLREDVIQVATTSVDLAVRKLLTIDGQSLSISDAVARAGLHVGSQLPTLDCSSRHRLTELNRQLARSERFWVKRLASFESVELPYANHASNLTGPVCHVSALMPLLADIGRALGDAPGAARGADVTVAALLAYFGRLSGNWTFDVGFSESALRHEVGPFHTLLAAQVPLHVALDEQSSLRESVRTIVAELADARRHKTYVRDVVARFPALRSVLARGGRPVIPIAVEIADDLHGWISEPGSALTVVVAADSAATRWTYDTAVFSADAITSMQQQFMQFLRAAADGDAPIGRLSLLTDEECRRLLVEWNTTRGDFPGTACIHQLFERQVDRTPNEIAVVCEDQHITYRELDARANRLARHLQTLDVGPEILVGICMERSIDLVVSLFAIHKAGGAYVPLDPTYPPARLSLMLEDSQVSVLLTQTEIAVRLPQTDAQVVNLDTACDVIACESSSPPSIGVTSDNLAYVIYTSGSTGKPKGVMVSHRNVVNFFAGMDDRLDRSPGSVWLAVTSLSFDISVLELLWTLTCGFKVVLHTNRETAAARAASRVAASSKPMELSLSYFASDEGDDVADKYHLLLEGAKFADRNGFAAVWTPERHFHAFGGLYPNPSIASAAIAAVTERVQIRAGSVVLPLHSPIRVAEEWSLVDNLSRGRVGISFASGWQPNDFVLAPDHFADRKRIVVDNIATVRKLWRGEGVPFPGPSGEPVTVRTLPRPVQAELPVWLTAAGSPETFRIAGELGAGVLTHLLGQSVEDLAEKIAVYRRAWHESGHSGSGQVTLMLHTFVGDDEASVRERVRAPMKEYLRSSVDLIKEAAWSFPAFANGLQTAGQRPDEIFESGELTEEEMEALLEHAFERYFRTSGLFGKPETCLAMVDRLRAIGVDEIACLIDFGVPSGVALTHLTHLKRLKDLIERAPSPEEDYSIPAQIERHGVTHLQCTPAMAGMLLMDERAEAALRPLKNLLIGGETFPLPLARQLTRLVAGDVHNMYGPTETTIWSSSYRLNAGDDTVPVGRPILNTELYVLDRTLQPAPIGVTGEFYIGGDGVVRGYLRRPELTDERFIADPFSGRPGARLYRTGDLARYRSDGNVELLGRIDHQVKIRGHRIELGEIEALLREQALVKDAVVVAREDVPGDVRLVGYVVPLGPAPDVAALRQTMKETLPETMVPAHIMLLDALPLTPNAKIDRSALPAPDLTKAGQGALFVAPGSDLETTIARIWQESLNLTDVGVNHNFFDLGGHSLLMVQVQQKLRHVLDRPLPITDLFRFPTVRSLAAHLTVRADSGMTMQQSVERAGVRREMRDLMMQRRLHRQTVSR